jgi:CTP synthase
VTIGVVGKYVGLPDAYKSSMKRWSMAGSPTGSRSTSAGSTPNCSKRATTMRDRQPALEPMHGILVPGGFGERGSEGKIASVRFARERNVPFFGICLGMQMACIEGARERPGFAAGERRPSSVRLTSPVVGIITEWMSKEGLQKREEGFGDLGGTMRLGAYPAKLSWQQSCRRSMAGPRHLRTPPPSLRGQWRVIEPLEKQGLIFSGMSPDGLLPEIVERPDHPWFVGRAVPPGAEIEALRSASPVCRVHRSAALEQSRLV